MTLGTTTDLHPVPTGRAPRAARLVLAATALAVFGSVLALPSTAWAVPVPWRNCGSPTDAISMARLDASVWPPQAGKAITLSSSWSLSEALTPGSAVKMTTQWSSGVGFQRTFEFDESPVAALFGFTLFGRPFSQQRMKLPIAEGPYTQNLTLNIPPKLSGRTVDVDMTGFDGAGRQVVCMQMVMPIK